MHADGDRTLFLTGGSGMVGRNLIERAPPGWRIVAPTHHELDLDDSVSVRQAIVRAAPDAVVHAAGRVGGIQANIAAPARFLADNIRMGLNVLDGAIESSAGVILNLASSCIYPPAAPNPLRESMLLSGSLEPTNEGYALAKAAVLRYGEYLNREHGDRRIKSLIPCNLFGRHDKFSPQLSHLVPAVIAKIHAAKMAGASTVDVWGDGSARREFLFASDAANWIWEAIAKFDLLPDMMNIGLGFDHSVIEYYKAVSEVVGWTGTFTFDTSRPTGMQQKLVDISRQRALGLTPSTPLVDSLRETYRFYLQEWI